MLQFAFPARAEIENDGETSVTRGSRFKALPYAAALSLAAFHGCATAPQAAPEASSADARPAAPPPAKPAPSAEPAPAAAIASPSTGGVELCPMEISNPPPLDANGRARGGPLVAIKGVALLLTPATNVCLSSGYGSRNGKLHRGVDYHTRTSGNALAAGDGVLLEVTTRADFGNMVVIDHGAGVYTRYAHLASFGKAAIQGAKVRRGEALGPIGATGATSVRHLHYEIMSGKYVSGVGTFGLSTHNPFDLPAP